MGRGGGGSCVGGVECLLRVQTGALPPLTGLPKELAALHTAGSGAGRRRARRGLGVGGCPLEGQGPCQAGAAPGVGASHPGLAAAPQAMRTGALRPRWLCSGQGWGGPGRTRTVVGGSPGQGCRWRQWEPDLEAPVGA